MPSAGDVVLWDPTSVGLDGWHANAAPGSRASVGVERGRAGAAALRLRARGPRRLGDRAPRARVRAAGALRRDAARCAARRTPAELQLKLVDPSGANVWWWRRRGFAPSRDGAAPRAAPREPRVRVGPAQRRRPGSRRRRRARGRVRRRRRGHALDRRPSRRAARAGDGPPRVRSRARLELRSPGTSRERVLERGRAACWRPAARRRAPLARARPRRAARVRRAARRLRAATPRPRCRLLASDDGARWTRCSTQARRRRGARRWLAHRRGRGALRAPRARGRARAGVARVAVVPIELAVSPARYAAARARAAPRGRYPRHLLGEHALLGRGRRRRRRAQGPARRGRRARGRRRGVHARAVPLERRPPALLGRRRARRRRSPTDACRSRRSSGTRRASGCAITAFARGDAGPERARRALRASRTPAARRATRAPLPRDPPLPGDAGVAEPEPRPAPSRRSRASRATAARVRVNAAREVVAVQRARRLRRRARRTTASRALFEGRLPDARGSTIRSASPRACSPSICALAPGGARDASWSRCRSSRATPPPPAGLARAEAAAWGEARLAEARARWRARLARVPIALPPARRPFEESLRASLAWILVNREGPRIQPGPRCYRRSWIRDGTLTGTALAEMGFADEARAFLRWYAPLPASRTAACRAPSIATASIARSSTTATASSSWGVVELFRLTRRRGVPARALAARAARGRRDRGAARASARATRCRGDARFGLLPESISHEGYASQPVALLLGRLLRGARARRRRRRRARRSATRRPPRASARCATRCARDLHASIARAMAQHGIDFVPGSAELGDFDPTSTAIALDPCGEGARLPRAALERTFERYWQELEARRRGEHAARRLHALRDPQRGGAAAPRLEGARARRCSTG